jgi:hypothetical protein
MCPLEFFQRRPRGVADVEATVGAAQVTVAIPANIALHLVAGIESAPLDQALRQTQRQGRVVGPLPRLQLKRPAASDVPHRRKRTRRLEFDRRPQRIADGKAEERSTISINFHVRSMGCLVLQATFGRGGDVHL